MKSKITLFLLIMSAGAAYGADEGRGGEGGAVGGAEVLSVSDMTSEIGRLLGEISDVERRNLVYLQIVSQLSSEVHKLEQQLRFRRIEEEFFSDLVPNSKIPGLVRAFDFSKFVIKKLKEIEARNASDGGLTISNALLHAHLRALPGAFSEEGRAIVGGVFERELERIDMSLGTIEIAGHLADAVRRELADRL